MDTKGRFTLFLSLPIKLRLKIWEYALSGPVIVDFIPKPGTSEFLMGAGGVHAVRPILSMAHLRIGQTCKEARRIVGGSY